MMKNLLQTIHDPRVRDLVWVMAAPSLMRGSSAPYFAVPDAFGQEAVLRAMPALQALDSEPAALHDWIAARKPQRLGRYFETLLEYWLSHLIGGQLVAANLRVKAGDIVMGEYDFLWRDVAGALNHWEASVKFYLQVDAAAGLAGYVGTLTRDRLRFEVCPPARQTTQARHHAGRGGGVASPRRGGQRTRAAQGLAVLPARAGDYSSAGSVAAAFVRLVAALGRNRVQPAARIALESAAPTGMAHPEHELGRRGVTNRGGF